METMQVTLTLAGIGFAAFASALMVVMKMWQGWLDLKQAELGSKRAPAGEEKVDIAELRVRVRQLEEIAACVDI
jgi:hypothetical protein